jgi:hypothetical protein
MYLVDRVAALSYVASFMVRLESVGRHSEKIAHLHGVAHKTRTHVYMHKQTISLHFTSSGENSGGRAAPRKEGVSYRRYVDMFWRPELAVCYVVSPRCLNLYI